MSLTKITCPHCKSVLKPPKPVPEGQKLKCPKCQKSFVAGAEPDEAGIVESPDIFAPNKKLVADEIDVIDILQDDEPVKKPEKTPDKKSDKKAEKTPDKKPAAATSEDDSGGTYGLADKDEKKAEEPKKGKKGKKKKKASPDEPDEETDYTSSLAAKDPRGPAQEQVIICSNYMLLSAIIGFVGYTLLVIIVMIPAVTPITSEVGTKTVPLETLQINGGLGDSFASPDFSVDNNTGPKGLTKDDKEKPSVFTVFGVDMATLSHQGIPRFILILLPMILGMAYCGIIAYGSVTTQSMESRPWGIAVSIITMIPYHILGVVVVVSWLLEILLVGVLENEPDSPRTMQYAVAAIFIIAEILVGIWVLTVLMKDDVKEGFEFKPE